MWSTLSVSRLKEWSKPMDNLHNLSQVVPEAFAWGKVPEAPENPQAEKRVTTYAVDADGKTRTGKGRVLVAEDSWESRWVSHLSSAALAVRNRYGLNTQWRDPETHRVAWTNHWTYMDNAVVAGHLWDYTLTYAADHLDHTDEKRPRLYRKVKVAQMERIVQRVAEWSGEHWMEWHAEESLKRRYAAVRGGQSHAPRQPTVTVDMVRPYLDQLRGLTLTQAAERLASWDWDTKQVRHSAKTFQRRLRELDFDTTGAEAGKRTRSLHPSMLDGMDGMTIAQQAEALETSVSTIKRLRAQRGSNPGTTKSKEESEEIVPQSEPVDTTNETEPHFNNRRVVLDPEMYNAATLDEAVAMLNTSDPDYWSKMLMLV
ncbi:hypothetical protein [Curtobacterium sp. MCPF17_052]|uniref:hypothetical protein n=1 Tax=Curtobacterium sp. MCPF17_052 TaxID=2175655 RepID=UPI0024DF9E6D|nr:hypothetical protein [Curtobacterium sp. MCPF17_052]WIB12905.1 hypothetical protein DEJ36_02450 [Curtobacterium sp. MCPF17_052]